MEIVVAGFYHANLHAIADVLIRTAGSVTDLPETHHQQTESKSQVVTPHMLVTAPSSRNPC